MTTKVWLHTIVAAAIGAVSAAITTTIASPSTFNFTTVGLQHLATVCGVSALLAVAAVLKQSPLPPDAPATPSSGTGAAVIVALLFASLVMTGCTGQQTAADLISIVGTATIALETLEGNGAAAQKLQADFNAADTAILNFKSGTPAQEVIEALNLVQDDLNLLPVSTQDQALVDLAIGTIDQILALLPAPAVAPVPAAARPTLSTAAFVTFTHPAVPHRHPHLAKTPKTAKQFRTEWNKLVGSRHEIVLPAK